MGLSRDSHKDSDSQNWWERGSRRKMGEDLVVNFHLALSPGVSWSLKMPLCVCVCVCVCVHACVCACICAQSCVCVYAHMCKCAQSCLTLCQPHGPYHSWPGFSVHGNSPSKNTEVGCHALLQGIFPTQGSDPCLLH